MLECWAAGAQGMGREAVGKQTRNPGKEDISGSRLGPESGAVHPQSKQTLLALAWAAARPHTARLPARFTEGGEGCRG